MKNKTWNIIEKIFDSFPFQCLISCVFGGFIYFVTPDNASLLLKFGIFWYIAFISLITFLTIVLIMWIYNVIKSNIESRKCQEQQTDETLERLRKQLYSITDKWSEDDIKTLRELVESDNEPILRTGHCMGDNSIFTSHMLESKDGGYITQEVVEEDGISRFYSSSTIYWLRDDVYKLYKIILMKYGKLSKFDNNKGENNGKN